MRALGFFSLLWELALFSACHVSSAARLPHKDEFQKKKKNLHIHVVPRESPKLGTPCRFIALPKRDGKASPCRVAHSPIRFLCGVQWVRPSEALERHQKDRGAISHCNTRRAWVCGRAKMQRASQSLGKFSKTCIFLLSRNEYQNQHAVQITLNCLPFFLCLVPFSQVSWKLRFQKSHTQ